MNTKNRSSSFPFRRGAGKKRPKPTNNKGRGGGGGSNYRSLPGNIGDLMSVMPSATKSVAQFISGNTKPSGQVAHARSVLARAQKSIDEKLTERLPPGVKDDFLEQVALLRLTLADAASLDDQSYDSHYEDENPSPPPAEISMDRLRALALSIAGNAQSPVPVQQPQEPDHDDDAFNHEALAAATASLKSSTKSTPSKTSATPKGLNNTSDKLRLKSMLDERRNSGDD